VRPDGVNSGMIPTSCEAELRATTGACVGLVLRGESTVDDVPRLLEVVRRELGADDARLEIGGRDPDDDAVWCEVEEGVRLRAIFDSPPEANAAELRERLEALVTSFAETLQSAPTPSRRPLDPQHALDDALEVLTAQAGSLFAVVIDHSSPVVWGTSARPRGPEDLNDAARAAEAIALANAMGIDLPAVMAGETEELAPELSSLVGQLRASAAPEGDDRDAAEWGLRFRLFAALSALRGAMDEDETGTRHAVHDPDLAFLARSFGGIYWLLLVFDETSFSELHAEAALIHAQPWIERLVEALPPVDPGGGGRGMGRVLRLRHLRPV